jgi:hypothetical protein
VKDIEGAVPLQHFVQNDPWKDPRYEDRRP